MEFIIDFIEWLMKEIVFPVCFVIIVLKVVGVI